MGVLYETETSGIFVVLCGRFAAVPYKICPRMKGFEHKIDAGGINVQDISPVAIPILT